MADESSFVNYVIRFHLSTHIFTQNIYNKGDLSIRDYSNMRAQQFGKGLFGLKKYEVYTFLREAETDFKTLRSESEELAEQVESITKVSQENQLKCFNLQKEIDELKAAVKEAEERADKAEAEVAKAQAAVKAAQAAKAAPKPQAKPGAKPAPGQAPKAAPKPQPKPKPQPAPAPKAAPKPQPKPQPAAMYDEEDDDDVFSGEVEDNVKVSNAFRIGNDDDEDAGFDFL